MFYYHYRVLTLSFQQNLELSFRCFTSLELFLLLFFFCVYHSFYGVESYHQFIFRAPSLAKLLAHFLLIFSPSVSKSLSSFLSKNSFSLGNLYFFCIFVPFGFLEEFVALVLLRSLFLLVFWWFFSGPFEEFVPFGLLEEFGSFWSFSGVWVAFGLFGGVCSLLVLLSIFGPFERSFCFFGPFRSFWGVCSFWSFGRVWLLLVLLRSLFLLVFWKEVWSSWSFVSEFAPVPSSVFSTSHEQRLLVEMKLILLKLKL